MDKDSQSRYWEIWDLPQNGSVFTRNLFQFCLDRYQADRCLFVFRKRTTRARGAWRYDSPAARKRMQRIINSYGCDRMLCKAWPGKQLVEERQDQVGAGEVHVIRFDRSTADQLLALQPDLSHWRHRGGKPLPEDLCLFREGDSAPSLVSVTHERMAWIRSKSRPVIEGYEDFEAVEEASLLAFGGKYFCEAYDSPQTTARKSR